MSELFEVGKIYRIELDIEGEGRSILMNCTVVAIDGSLIKIVQNGDEEIINTASRTFIS